MLSSNKCRHKILLKKCKYNYSYMYYLLWNSMSAPYLWQMWAHLQEYAFYICYLLWRKLTYPASDPLVWKHFCPLGLYSCWQWLSTAPARALPGYRLYHWASSPSGWDDCLYHLQQENKQNIQSVLFPILVLQWLINRISRYFCAC